MKARDLAKRLAEEKEAYYYGKPKMSDAEFDSLVLKLKKLDPKHPILRMVGAPVPGTEKYKHLVPMGSLENAMKEKEFISWLESTANGSRICLQHKLDGLSIELIYEDGIFMQALTRGDGREGEDVTQNVLRSRSIPFRIDRTECMSVKAEALILIKDFEKQEVFKEMANPRNAAAGTIRRQDGAGAEYLKIVAYSMEPSPENNEKQTVERLKKMGFLVTKLYTCGQSYKFLKDIYDRELGIRENLDYEIDGLVAKIDDRRTSRNLGEVSDLIPRGQIAWKFPPRGGESVLLDVVWSVGHIGHVTPVAKIKPVKVSGVTISSVTLCNPDEIERLGIGLQDTIEVQRAGDTIPKITKMLKKSKKGKAIPIPTECPECGRDLIRKGAYLICDSDDCPAQVEKKIMHWIKERNILEIGDEILESLCTFHELRKIKHLYELNVPELSLVKVGNGELGKSRAKKIVENIQASKSMSISEFYGCLGIPSMGKSLATKIVKELGVTDAKDFLDLKYQDLVQAPGVGEERGRVIRQYLKDKSEEIEELLAILDVKAAKTGGKLNGARVCCTGAAMLSRDKIHALIEEAGGEVKTSVTKDLDYLVQADENSNSGKSAKAKKYGVKCISEGQLLEMIGWNGKI